MILFCIILTILAICYRKNNICLITFPPLAILMFFIGILFFSFATAIRQRQTGIYKKGANADPVYGEILEIISTIVSIITGT
jgi:hypothetical protein